MQPLLAVAFTVICAVVCPSRARAEEHFFGFRMEVYCPSPSGGLVCGRFASEDDLKLAVLRNIQEMNLEFIPTGLHFGPDGDDFITFHYDTEYEHMTSGDESDDLLADLQAKAAANSDVIMVFMIWDGTATTLDTNFTSPPPKPDLNSNYGIWYVPSASGQTYAHEMAHYWCLRHTHSGSDPFDADEDGVGDVDYDSTGADFGAGWVDFGVDDTPADPGPAESDDGEAYEGPSDANHDWCEETVMTAVDPGSPHSSWCTIKCYHTKTSGRGDETDLPRPFPYNVMSYYWDDCRGPYVRNSGKRTEAFTDDQVAQVAWCLDNVADRQKLEERCVVTNSNQVLDQDYDGICGAGGSGDNCPFSANTDQADRDADGVGDVCDSCPDDKNAGQLDSDHDGVGNACDPDRDGDGCDNDVDQHPDDSYVKVGSWQSATCEESSGDSYGFEGDDSDGDGTLDCEEVDDDDDLVPDRDDACPTTKAATCIEFKDCTINGYPIFFTCAGGGCNELFAVLVDSVNPDPTRGIRFDVSIIDNVLYLHRDPFGQRTLSELADAMTAPVAVTGAGAGRQLELRKRSDGSLVALVARWDGARALLGETRFGTMLRFAAPAELGTAPQIESTWVPGLRGNAALRDRDRDTIPDIADDCLAVANVVQIDSDRDGFGDPCDMDFDQDGVVREADVAFVSSCVGVALDTTREHIGTLVPDRHLSDAAFAEVSRCKPADVDQSRVVDLADVRLAQEARGSAPGPSARRLPLAGGGQPDQGPEVVETAEAGELPEAVETTSDTAADEVVGAEAETGTKGDSSVGCGCDAGGAGGAGSASLAGLVLAFLAGYRAGRCPRRSRPG